MRTRKDKRLDILEDALRASRAMHLRDAAKLLQVSTMTVRRDLANAPERFTQLGAFVVPAGHVLADAAQQGGDPAPGSELKHAAARHAARELRHGDSVFIDGGEEAALIAEHLPAECALTVVCHSLTVADLFARRGNVEMVMLGGVYQATTRSFHGRAGLAMLKHMALDVAMVSAEGVGAAGGEAFANQHEVALKRAVMGTAVRSFLVVESATIGLERGAIFARLADFDAVITEAGGSTVHAAYPSLEVA